MNHHFGIRYDLVKEFIRENPTARIVAEPYGMMGEYIIFIPIQRG